MSESRQPPALLLKTLTVTFGLVTLLLLIVFAVVFYTVRIQVRQSVISSRNRCRACLRRSTRRQRDLPGQAATVAENSTLKAALDTYIAEAATSDSAGRQQLLTTITRELEKVAARVQSDAIVAVDMRQTTLAVAGPFAGRGRSVASLSSPPQRPRGRRRHARGRGHIPHPDRPAAGRRPANRFAISGHEAGCSSGAGARQPVARAERHRHWRTSAGDGASPGPAATSGVTGADEVKRRCHPERRVVGFQRVGQLVDASFYALSSIDGPEAHAMKPILPRNPDLDRRRHDGARVEPLAGPDAPHPDRPLVAPWRTWPR